ncbi:hypothetical protein EDE15_1050 [Edaphobacter aggregans]|uniref:Uncharacterized protein n=1 Tax=Edaphobacter aggregans TaxID=570835 RepID=A0A3R9R1D7_9BACT|nr:hypothetical protein [Edaphobacter aggregans]RSL15559.1 hypothetical protein EDE15_1050 [Edaphobacter aggregans]
MAIIDCNVYVYRDPSFPSATIWVEADDGRAWVTAVGKLGLLQHEAVNLPHELRHSPPSDVLGSLKPIYKFLGSYPFDEEVLDNTWDIDTPPNIAKTK